MLIFLLALSLTSASQVIKSHNGIIDTIATISSFSAVGDFYKMDYQGDYNDLLDSLDNIMTGATSIQFQDFKCSLFKTSGNLNNQLLGRNFDNNDNDVLLARYSPPDGFASVAFTRMSDLGFAHQTNYDNLQMEQKLSLLHATYFVPDGINSEGLACGLAYVDPVTYTINPEKDTIFITRLVREILDHASTLDEATDIANSYNVFDGAVNIISHHVLVGTLSGSSIILEFAEGEFKAIQSDYDWQVLTNSPIYNRTESQLMNTCWRYNSLFNDLEDASGKVPWYEGMDMLENVHMNCPWSAVYDLNNLSIYIAIDNNFENITYTDLETFVFDTEVGINHSLKTDAINLKSYPNPYTNATTIEYNVSSKAFVELHIYNNLGERVATLVNKKVNAGHYKTVWNGKNDFGERVPTGIYLYMINYKDVKETRRLIRIDH